MIGGIHAALASSSGKRPIVTLPDITLFASEGGSASYSLKTDGVAEFIDNGGVDNNQSWIAPVHNLAAFEVRATVQSGDTPDTGTFGSWLALSTTRTWGEVNAGFGFSSTILIEVRYGGGAVIDTATVQIIG